MRNLEQSTVFSTPVLVEVKSTLADNIRANDFSLRINLRGAETKPGDGKPGQKGKPS
ncbi:hypothetical protein D3C85_1908440 [compost metagenome]